MRKAARPATTSVSTEPEGPFVESVRRALRVLGAFSLDRPEVGISEIGEELGMHKSTVHRLLATLEVEGFVRSTDQGRYVLGWRVLELGAAVSAGGEIREKILDTLSHVVRSTGETAHLAVLDGGEVLYVEKVESERTLRMPSSVGRRLPAHVTALGKVLLSGLEESARLKLIYGRELAPLTDRSIVDPDELRKAVAQAGERGYAIDDQEIDDGLICIAAPVTEPGGEISAAISISGPVSRVEPNLDAFIEVVVEAAAELSRQLGPQAGLLRGHGYANVGDVSSLHPAG